MVIDLRRRGGERPQTLFSFEPNAEALFDACCRSTLPRASIRPCRSRRIGVGIAPTRHEGGHDNADDLIKALTLEANRERQLRSPKKSADRRRRQTRSPTHASPINCIGPFQEAKRK